MMAAAMVMWNPGFDPVSTLKVKELFKKKMVLRSLWTQNISNSAALEAS